MADSEPAIPYPQSVSVPAAIFMKEITHLFSFVRFLMQSTAVLDFTAQGFAGILAGLSPEQREQFNISPQVYKQAKEIIDNGPGTSGALVAYMPLVLELGMPGSS